MDMDMDKRNSILIVDDEVANIRLLLNILGAEYKLFAASNGKDAIEAAEKHSPDIILLDIIMPEMDGYDVIAALRSREITKDIPVIFISGLGEACDEEKGLACGAADYISKPFSPVVVKHRVRNQTRFINMRKDLESALNAARDASGAKTQEVPEKSPGLP